MSTLTIRFAGICCFLDARPGQDGFQKRVILPIDKHVQERHDGLHIPYIEVDLLDRPQVSGRFVDDKLYARQSGSYHRFHLSGDRIRIVNAQRPAYGFRELSTYQERVPHLSKITPGLPYPDVKFFNYPPPSDIVAAVFDIEFGDLHAGPASLLPTKFTPQAQWPTRRLASWVELQVPIEDGKKPKLEIQSFNDNGFGTRTIEIAETADHVTIGNQLVNDIERPDSALSMEDFSAHFSLIYDLFSNIPPNAARPSNTFTTVNGCIGSNIP